MFAATTARTVLKAQLLQSLQSNQIEITDDLQMTDIESRILQHEKSDFLERSGCEVSVDQCRVCLTYGNGLVNLFEDLNETPSTIDKLMECSRISQVDSMNFFVYFVPLTYRDCSLDIRRRRFPSKHLRKLHQPIGNGVPVSNIVGGQ